MTGRIAGLAVKVHHRAPMEDGEFLELAPEHGIAGNVRTAPKHQVTFVAREQWAEAVGRLNADLPWQTRRANVLLEGLRMIDLLGQRLRIGDVVVEIKGETEPCEVMDRQYQGLRRALEPECRGGVHGRIIQGGVIREGDVVAVEAVARV